MGLSEIKYLGKHEGLAPTEMEASRWPLQRVGMEGHGVALPSYHQASDSAGPHGLETQLLHPRVLEMPFPLLQVTVRAAPEACPVRAQATSLLEDGHTLPTHDILS